MAYSAQHLLVLIAGVVRIALSRQSQTVSCQDPLDPITRGYTSPHSYTRLSSVNVPY